MARIAIDCRSMHRGQGGIGRYADELTRALGQIGSAHEYELIHGASLPDGFDHAPPDPPHVRRHAFEAGMIDPRWEQLHLATELERLEADLYHATCFALPIARGQTKTVATVHDVVFRAHPEWVEDPLRAYLDRWTEISLEIADRIVTVSEWSKAEIVRCYGVAPERITVIHNGVSARFGPRTVEEQAACRQRHELPDAFALYLGAIEPKKNLDLVLDAYRILGDRGSVYVPPLVLAGARGGQAYDLERAIRDRGLASCVRALGYVPDADVPALLASARLFVYPSRYEGFGLPILEAFASGTPVVAARASATPELTGPAAILVDPDGAEALADAIDVLHGDERTRERLRAAGRERAAHFTWVACARAHLALYERVLA